MKPSKLLVYVLLLALLLPLFAAGGQAQGPTLQAEPPPATALEAAPTTILQPGGITWQPRFEYAAATLTVAGPGDFWLRQEFPAGSTLSWDARAGDGQPLPDGQYTFELRFQPVLSAEARAALAAAEGTDQRDQIAAALREAGQLPEAPVLSGYFRVSGGSIVAGAAEEPEAPASPVEASTPGGTTPEGNVTPLDVLHYDDVIVTGSLCVGFDCINGESFFIDTIRLKENNLRIHFQDTSSIEAYPTNDWRIIVNDSDSGGANYFSVEDSDEARRIFTLEAGAPAHSLYVEDSGRVGLGTSTPVVELHIADSDTPTMRLEQDRSGGWTPQTWDVAGNETNFFVRDATNGSKLPFRIQPGAPDDSLTIKSDGKIGLGTWSPAYPLELETTGEDAIFAAERTDGATATVRAGGDAVALGSWTNHRLDLTVNGTPRMTIATDGRVQIGSRFDLDPSGNLMISGALCEASDVALKENFQPVDGEALLARILQLPVSTWNYRADDDTIRHMGPTAQDFYRLFGLGPDDEHIAPLDANGVALAGLQELGHLVREQEAQIQALEQENQELARRLADLEAVVQELLAARDQE
jgi:hypothetical protein